ncbi:hypothetical protein M404DRAFT_1004196 [Pisolithus tinctorius Marx 270]|uniref:Uncharacterized protein n=1 Tax=Pisolithus tinctorius Marx 270 TaxID=870435 RepID=A0A0C3NY46_PISTI|nr:hypothetical protein M404DRAFT_1004196 [Pisolithus tinctorius Marx 270]
MRSGQLTDHVDLSAPRGQAQAFACSRQQSCVAMPCTAGITTHIFPRKYKTHLVGKALSLVIFHI